MEGPVKILKATGDGTLRYASFFDQLAHISINPLYRNDFLGELTSCDTHQELSVADDPQEPSREIVVHKDSVQVFQSSREDYTTLKEELRSTYFSSALAYWKARNSTQCFLRLHLKLYPLSQNLPQLLHHASTLVNALLCEMENVDSLAREPAYHLLIILARDLCDEFSPFLPDVFRRLLGLLDAHNVFVIEMTFFSIGLLFKFLFRSILPKLKDFLSHFVACLSHHHTCIRMFAAEALSFLFRKAGSDALIPALDTLFLLCADYGTSIHHVTDVQSLCVTHENDVLYGEEDGDPPHHQAHHLISHDAVQNNATTLAEQEPWGHGSVRDIYLGESLGLVLFYLVKNVNATFTGKLVSVVQFMCDHVIHTQSFLQGKTRCERSILVYHVLTSTFFIQCRNHIRDWHHLVIDELNRHVDHLTQQLVNTVHDDEARVMKQVVALDVLLKATVDVVSIPPRPPQVPMKLLATLWSTISTLLRWVAEHNTPASSNDTLVKMALHPLRGLVGKNMFVREHVPNALASFSSLFHILANTCTTPPSLHQGALLSCVLDFTSRFTSRLIASGDPHECEAYTWYCIRLFYVVATKVCTLDEKHTVICWITRVVQQSTVRLSVDTAVDMKVPELCHELITVCLLEQQHTTTLEDVVCLERAFSSLYLLKILLCDKQLPPQLRSTVCHTTSFAHFLHHQAQMLQQLSTTHASCTEGDVVTRTKRLGLFLSYAACFFSLLCCLPDNTFIVSLFSEPKDPPPSQGHGLVCFVVMQWKNVLGFIDSEPSVESNFVSVTAHALCDMFMSLTTLVPTLVEDPAFSEDCSCLLQCLLLSITHVAPETRADIFKWIAQREEEVRFALCGYHGVLFHADPSDTRRVCLLFDDVALRFLPCAPHNQLQPQWRALVDSILHHGERLERLSVSVEHERDLTHCISTLAQDIVALSLVSRGSCWVELFAVQTLLCQLSRKFRPLWSPTLNALEQIVTELNVTREIPNCRSTVTIPNQHLEQSESSLDDYVHEMLLAWLVYRLRGCVVDALREKSEAEHGADHHAGNQRVGKRRRHPHMCSVTEASDQIDPAFAQALGVVTKNPFLCFETRERLPDTGYRVFKSASAVRSTDSKSLHTWCCNVMSVILRQPLRQGTSALKEAITFMTLRHILTVSLLHVQQLWSPDALEWETSDDVVKRGVMRDIDPITVQRAFHTAGPLRIENFLRLISSWPSFTLEYRSTNGCRVALVTLYDKLLDWCLHRVIQVPEKTLQHYCLELVLPRHPELSEYKTLLNDIVMDVRFTHCLLQFHMHKDEGIVAQHHRHLLVPLLTRILMSKLSQKTLSHVKQPGDPAARRKAIFCFLSQLPCSEIPHVFCSVFSCVLCIQHKDTSDVMLRETEKNSILHAFFLGVATDAWVPHWHQHTTRDPATHKQWYWSAPQSTERILLNITTLCHISRCTALLLTMEEMVIQMRMTLTHFSVFIFQLCLSLIDVLIPGALTPDVDNPTPSSDHTQRSEAAKATGNGSLEEEEHHPTHLQSKVVSRKLFGLIMRLMTMYPGHVTTWDACLLKVQPTIKQCLKTSLESGAVSTVLQCVLSPARHPLLFPLFKSSLHFVLPTVSEAIASQPVLAAVRKGNRTTSLVTVILHFSLRLCRGGHLSLEEATQTIRTAQKRLHQEAVRGRKRRKTRRDLTDSDSDPHEVDDSPERNALLSQWKAQVAQECELGLSIIQPFAHVLLRSISVLFAERQSSLHVCRSRKTKAFSLVSNEELDTITQLLRHVPVHNSSALDVVIRILLQVFPVSRRSSPPASTVTRQKLVCACLYEHLLHVNDIKTSHPVLTQQLLKDTRTSCRSFLQKVQDLDIRHDLAKLFVVCELIEAGCSDIPTFHVQLLSSFSINSPAQPAHPPDLLYINKWLPSSLAHELVFLHTTLAVHRQRVASIEPDDDLYAVLLDEITQHLLSPQNTALYMDAQNQQYLIEQCLFFLRSSTVDSSIRSMSVNIICRIIDRVHKIARLRNTLYASGHLSTSPHTSETPAMFTALQYEWEECSTLLRSLFYSVTTTVRYTLKSSDAQPTNAALRVVSHLVRCFHSVVTFLPYITPHQTSVFTSPFSDSHHARNVNLLSDRFHLDLYQPSEQKPTREPPAEVHTDVFTELLHVQHHRHMRGIHVLTQYMKQHSLSAGTAQWVCAPLAFSALLQQCHSGAAVHVGLAERAVECLSEAAKTGSWKFCVAVVTRLTQLFDRFSSKNKFILRALCGVITAVAFHVDSTVASYTQSVGTPNACLRETASASQPPLPHVQHACTSSASSDASTSSASSDASTSSAFSDACQRSVTEAYREKILSMQRTIASRLLPSLRRLSTPPNQAAHTSSQGEAHAPTLHPLLIVAQVQLVKLLPEKQFNAFLPKLLQTLASCLGLRDPEVRRKARTSVACVVSCLGPPYVDFVLRFLAQYLTKGYQVAVFTFTAASVLMELVLGRVTKGKAMIRSTCIIDPGSCDGLIDTLLPLVEQELMRFCDPSRPDFQNFVDHNTPAVKRAGVDEERYFKSPEILLLLARIASVDAVNTGLIPYLKRLLLGDMYNKIILNPTAASQKKYQHMVEHLFEQVVTGVSLNSGFTYANRLHLASRLLRLHTTIRTSLKNVSNATFTLAEHEHSDADVDKDHTFLSQFFSIPLTTDSVENNSTDDPRYCKHNTVLLQPGVATGHSVEQMFAHKRPIDPRICGEMFALSGLRLFLLTFQHMCKDGSFIQSLHTSPKRGTHHYTPPEGSDSVPPDQYIPLLKSVRACSTYVIQCFCAREDRLLLLSSKILMKLISVKCLDIDKHANSIATVVLRYAYQQNKREVPLNMSLFLSVLRMVCGSLFQDMGNTNAKTSADAIKCISLICVRLLAALLSGTTTTAWFNRIVKGRSTQGSSTFKTALLSQIRASLDDSRTRVAGLQLFRNVLLLREKTSIVTEPENCALVYQCVDDIGVLLVHHSCGVPQLISLCGTIYLDFLMNYPMPERIQKKRVNFLIRNLDSASHHSRQAVLSVLFSFINRLPLDILSSRYTTVLTLALMVRLTKEDHLETRLITRAVLKKLIQVSFPSALPLHLIRIATQAFTHGESVVMQAAFIEFLELAVSCTTWLNNVQRTSMYLDPIVKCLQQNTNVCSPHTVSQHDALLDVPYEKWKVSFAFVRFFERFLCRDVEELSVLLSPHVSGSFWPLWRYFIVAGCQHAHPWIKLKTLRILTFLLQKTKELNMKRKTNSVTSYLFSPALLPQLTSLHKSKGPHVMKLHPLSAVLYIYVNWSQTDAGETLGASTGILVSGITALCGVLMDDEDLLNNFLHDEQNVLSPRCSASPAPVAEEVTEDITVDHQSAACSEPTTLKPPSCSLRVTQEKPLDSTVLSLATDPNTTTHPKKQGKTCWRPRHLLRRHSPHLKLHLNKRKRLTGQHRVTCVPIPPTPVAFNIDQLDHRPLDTQDIYRTQNDQQNDQQSNVANHADRITQDYSEGKNGARDGHHYEHQELNNTDDEHDSIDDDDVNTDENEPREEEKHQPEEGEEEKRLDEDILKSVENLACDVQIVSQELEATVLDDMSPCPVTSKQRSIRTVLTVLKVSRIRWTIGKLMWSVKKGTACLTQSAVRICSALSILKDILKLLPSAIFTHAEGKHLLDSIIESFYVCSSLLKKRNTASTDVNDLNSIAVACQTALKSNPRALTGCVASFGEDLLEHVEKWMESQNMSSVYFQSLQRVQSTVGSRRLKRKQDAKRIKASDPQKAALNKILRHKKKRLTQKKYAHQRS